MAEQRKPLQYYLNLEYPYTVVPDDGAYFIRFPDLPGCMTQVEEPSEIAVLAEEIRTLWIEGEYEDGAEIPEPTGDASRYSGKFQLRLPKRLHRDLAEAAEREGTSLNAYVNYLLAERSMAAKVQSRLDRLGALKQEESGKSVDDGDESADALTEVQRRTGLRLIYSETVAV